MDGTYEIASASGLAMTPLVPRHRFAAPFPKILRCRVKMNPKHALAKEPEEIAAAGKSFMIMKSARFGKIHDFETRFPNFSA